MGSLVLNTAEFTCAFGGTEAQHRTGLKRSKRSSLQVVARSRAEGRSSQKNKCSCVLQDVHDGVVELGEHHEVHGQAGAAVLRGRVTREPGQGVVLLQHEPAQRHRHHSLPWGCSWALLDLHPDRAASVSAKEEPH